MRHNLLKIPRTVRSELTRIKSNAIVVGCAAKYKSEDLSAGCLKHLGVSLTEQGLQLSGPTLPPTTRGRYSKQNVAGKDVIRKDLPRVLDSTVFTSPNFGDWGKGSHVNCRHFKRFARDFRPPRELEIETQCADARPNLPAYAISFRVAEILDRTDEQFEQYLLEDLNLLQENIGNCGVVSSQTPLPDYIKTLYVSWDILPPGSKADAIGRLFKGRSPKQSEVNTAEERYDFFASLDPKNLICGNSGFRRYFGALLEDDLVVFENIQYGNAVYILFGNWEELSKKSRIDLLSGKFGNSFKRITHGPEWKLQVRACLSEIQRNRNKLF